MDGWYIISTKPILETMHQICDSINIRGFRDLSPQTDLQIADNQKANLTVKIYNQHNSNIK